MTLYQFCNPFIIKRQKKNEKIKLVAFYQKEDEKSELPAPPSRLLAAGLLADGLLEVNNVNLKHS